MISKRIIIMGVFLTLISFTYLGAQGGIAPYDIERVGLSGWQFLKITYDARYSAIGGAFTALSHGNSGAIFGNPSALVDVGNVDVQFTNVNWIADIKGQSIAIAKNFGRMGVLGFSVVSLNVGEMYETINRVIPGETRTEAVVTGNTFTAGDLAAGISYAKRVTDRLSIGANVRWIREEIAEVSMNNVSVDFGTTYYTGFKSLRLCMVARNFGPDAHLVGWSEEYQMEAVDIRMPLDFRVGIGYDFFEGSSHVLSCAIEGTHPNDGPEKINIGLEYKFGNLLVLRSGYRVNYDEEDFTLGGEINYTIGGLTARVGYAYINFGILEQVHMFTLGLSL
ncbi:MAG: PorV/PorQ family protein [Candidatus Marinimicrobia bacterium]|nr:PorV/PorQ family protein [Candidatus Neomarinimicrobiota bacterium]